MAMVMVNFSLMCPLCGRLVDELRNQRGVGRAGGGQALRRLVFLDALHAGLAEDAVGLDIGTEVERPSCIRRTSRPRASGFALQQVQQIARTQRGLRTAEGQVAGVAGDDSEVSVVVQNHTRLEQVDDELGGLLLCRCQHERDSSHEMD